MAEVLEGATAPSTNGTMIFITIADFKTKVGVAKVDIVRNPNTGLLFGSTERGKFKVQQNITNTKDIKFMYESEDKFLDGCIVNTVPTTPPVMVL